MKLSVEWIKDYVALPDGLTSQQIAHDLTMSTVEVEAATDISAALRHVVVGRIEQVETLDLTKDHLMTVNIGTASCISIISNGQGVQPGLDTIVALPGAYLLSNGRAEVLEDRRVDGHKSEGVICLAEELGLGGLLPISGENEAVDLSAWQAVPGASLAELIGWQDIVLDIDNKSLTNRPDLWCHLGIARELAAIYGVPLQDPRLRSTNCASAPLIGELAQDLCARYDALRLENVSKGSSPFWMRSRLARIGQRPGSALRDLANYVMFDVGQPVQIYDAAMVSMPISVRRGQPGETLCLHGQTKSAEVSGVALVTGNDCPVAVAGVVSGSETSYETDSAILEFANYDPISVRRSSMTVGCRTEASARFEKAIDVQRVEIGIQRFCALLKEAVPGARITARDGQTLYNTMRTEMTIDMDFLLSRLGKRLEVAEVEHCLRVIGFDVALRDETLHVKAPSWRSTGDITTAYDLVEEVARLHGYENFNFTPPNVTITAPATSRHSSKERRMLETFASFGLQEVILYPWVNRRFLEASGYAVDECSILADPPSPEQAALQPSLVPGLLECIETNLRYRDRFAIFTCDDIYLPQDNGPPRQRRELAGAFVGAADLQGLLRRAKGVLQALSRNTHLPAFTFVASDAANAWASPHASMTVQCDGDDIGRLAVLSDRSRGQAELTRAEVVVFCLNLEAVRPYATRENAYARPPMFQQAQKDLSMIFPDRVQWADVHGQVYGSDPLIRDCEFVDLYMGAAIPADHRSITLRLTLGSDHETLDGAAIEAAVSGVISRLEAGLGGTLRC